MNEIILIKVLLFFEICRMSLKCFKRFPKEYISEKFYLLEHEWHAENEQEKSDISKQIKREGEVYV